MNNIIIEEYSAEYFEQLAKLLNNVYRSKISKNDLEKFYLSENKKIFLAKKNEIIIGCAFLEIKIDYIRTYKYGYVTYVAVRKECRKQGVGKKLLMLFLLKLKNINVQQLN